MKTTHGFIIFELMLWLVRKKFLCYGFMYETLDVWMKMFMTIHICWNRIDLWNFAHLIMLLASVHMKNGFHSWYMNVCPGNGPYDEICMNCIIWEPIGLIYIHRSGATALMFLTWWFGWWLGLSPSYCSRESLRPVCRSGVEDPNLLVHFK